MRVYIQVIRTPRTYRDDTIVGLVYTPGELYVRIRILQLKRVVFTGIIPLTI